MSQLPLRDFILKRTTFITAFCEILVGWRRSLPVQQDCRPEQLAVQVQQRLTMR
jgi:hypothetical protein